MQFSYSPYILPLIFAALISGWVMIYAWQRRRAANAAALALLAFGITEWLLAYGLEIAGTNLPTKMLWGKFQYIGITLAPLAWLVLAYFQSNQGKRPQHRYLLLLAAIPVITMLLAFTTEFHGLIWGTIDIYQTENFSALGVSHGPWFWVHTAYSYLLLLAGTIIILRGLGKMQGLYRGQTVALIIAVSAPWLGNALYLSGFSPIPNLDLTPFAFAISLAGLAWGIFGYQLVNISPMARDLIVDGMSEGMIALDLRGRIADMNPAAARMIGVPAAQAVGKPVAEVLSPWPHLIERFRGVLEASDEIFVGEGEARRRYEIRIAPLRDQAQNALGRLITIRDASAGFAPHPRFAVREPEKPHQIETEPEARPEPPSRQSRSILGWFIAFISTPVKADLQAPPNVNPKWFQARERSFTLILRVAALLGTVALLVAPSFTKLAAGLPFAIIITLIWFLGLARQIDFKTRTIVFLGLVYALASVETYNFGFSAASFSFYMTLVVTATLLLGRNGGLVTFALAFITILAFGLLIGSGSFLPINAHEGLPVPGTVQRALTSLLAFTASAAAMIAAVIILMESLNKAWQLETQALNLLQQERDLLEQRVIERTRDLAQAHDEAVKTSNELRKYFLAIEQSGNTIVITDTEGNLEYANPHFEQLTGYSLAEVHGKNPRFLKSGEHSQEFYQTMWDTISAGQIWHGEFHNRRKDGSLFWESATIAPVQNHLGQITNFVAIKENITAQKELQEQLRQQNEQMAQEISNRIRTNLLLQESEARFRQIVENASDAIYRADLEGRFTYANPTTLHIMGCQAESDFVGKHYLELVSPAARHRVKRFYEYQFLSGTLNTYYEIPALTHDGREIWLGQNAQLVKEGDQVIGFQAVARDITEIKQAQEALALARDQALEANRLKTQFLAKISHELRTPLGSVIGYAELIRDEFFGSITDEQKEPINHIVENANYLTSMVNELLDEAQIESKNLTLKMDWFSPADLMEKVRRRITVLAEKKGLALNTDLLPFLPAQLYGDEKRLQQILVNLAGNAIKFTRSGEVNLRLYLVDTGHWGIQVADTGAGIPKEAQPLVFEPFRQVDNAITRENRGTGLGLAIVKQLVELMDGEISLESEPGLGSTFTIKLPILHKPGPEF